MERLKDTTKVTVRVPASTANLGPGFDTLALALCLYTRMTFTLSSKNDPDLALFSLKGEQACSLPRDRSNMVFKILEKVWRDQDDLIDRVRIHIETDIPLARGLGSSAACVVGTVAAARALAGEDVSRGKILEEAALIEGHPDNVAASIYGGLVVSSCCSGSKQVSVQKLVWPVQWRTIVVVPQYQLSTKKAREVLPAAVPLADAVANVQKVGLLLAAVANCDGQALASALHDRLHEPYRQELIPELAELRKLMEKSAVLGCVLSGAGPSVLVLVEEKNVNDVKGKLNDWANSKKEKPEIFDLAVDDKGLEVSYE